MTRRLGVRRIAGHHTPAGLVKATSGPTMLPGGATIPAGSQVTDATNMLGALQARTGMSVNGSTPLPRAQQYWALMGPGAPLYPAPLNTPNPATGQADPRRWQYPVSWNLTQDTGRLVDWSTLRDAARNVDLISQCIRVRRTEQSSLDWDITLTRRTIEANGVQSNQDKQALLKKYSAEISRLIEFWSEPDTTNGYTWPEWVEMLMHEAMVTDAVSIFPRHTYGGDLVSLELVDGACYSADTEVLTEDGWKTFDQVDLTVDRFATRNQKTHAFEWQEATYFHEADWDSAVNGPCYAFTSRTLDLLVTPNHRMLVNSLPRALGGSRHTPRGEHFVRAEDLYRHGTKAQAIPAVSEWDAPDLTSFELPASGRTTSMPFSCTGDQFAAFMGMWLAEGSRGGADQVVITQMPYSKGYVPFRALLADIFGRAVCHTGKDFVIGRKSLHDYLAQFGHAADKFVPALLKNASRRQLEIFWRYYMLGDGHYAADGREGINTVSRRMADDLQEIAQKIGYSASVTVAISTTDSVFADGRVIRAENKRPRYTIRLRSTREQRYDVAPVDYVGKVYCVSVPNEVLYVRRNGQPAWCGNTIKPLLDERGNRPRPPAAAYQQWMYGFPRGEYTDAGAGEPDWSGTAGSLIYKPRYARVESPYGYSPVEQALVSAELWLRRQQWMVAEYTSGTAPRMVLKSNVANYTPEQLRAWEDSLNDYYGGSTGNRHRMRLFPEGFDPTLVDDAAERYKPDYDEFLVKLICAHMDVQPEEIGFSPRNGIGGAGHGESQEAITYRKALRPTAQWLVGIMNQISYAYLGMPRDLTFQFLGLEDEDQDLADQTLDRQFRAGRITMNESRDKLGQPRYDFAEADMPMLVTQRGVVFLENASELVEPGELVSPVQAPPLQAPEGADSEEEGQPVAPVVAARHAKAGAKAPAKEAAAAKDESAGEPTEAQKAEFAAYRNWARKPRNAGGTFEFTTVSKADAERAGVDLGRVVFKAGGGRPKGPVRREWPGWKVDQAAARLWAGRISEGLTGALDARTLAADWLAVRKAAPAMPPGATDAESWLASQGVTLTASLRGVLRNIYTDGWIIGDRSAMSLVEDIAVDWAGWTPGDEKAALAIIGGDRGLEQLLTQADVTISSIAEHRMDALALELATALENGSSVDTLARALRGVLDNPSWAEMVATTELNRAMSSATLARYAENGIEASWWMTAEDERVCPDCGGNEDAGAVPIDQPFPNGSYQPPAHPICRCALAPVL